MRTDPETLAFVNSLSNSFCGAKWYNATIWLGSGMTTSCHHPPAHKIDPASLVGNPAALHNTPQKKADRLKMQCGNRPEGCEYCWKIEDMKKDAISDRVYKSKIYNDEDMLAAATSSWDADVDLKTLEISFDRTCNLACSYCNPAFSSTWVRDIKSSGPYTNLVSDGRNHFTHAHDSAQLFPPGETNPYVEAFFEWWDTKLHLSLDELRLTGGEPLMSPETWRLFDWFKTHNSKPIMRLAVNTNLMAKPVLINRLIEASHSIPNFHVYTSAEATGVQAEYIRDGLVWSQFTSNLERLITEGNVAGVHMMATVNALCLPTLPDFLDWCLELKARHGRDTPVFSLNILRFPSFQSALVLPNDKKQQYSEALASWLAQNKHNPLCHDMERDQVARLIDYLVSVSQPTAERFDLPRLHNDVKHFYAQYDARRAKDFATAFPDLAPWYHSL